MKFVLKAEIVFESSQELQNSLGPFASGQDLEKPAKLEVVLPNGEVIDIKGKDFSETSGEVVADFILENMFKTSKKKTTSNLKPSTKGKSTGKGKSKKKFWTGGPVE